MQYKYTLEQEILQPQRKRKKMLETRNPIKNLYGSERFLAKMQITLPYEHN